MGSACGGYVGWPGLSTQGADSKVTMELSVFNPANPLEDGLFAFYVNYNGLSGFPGMKAVSTYRDGTAPFGVFTTDVLLEQHFSDHVGVNIAQANDRNGDGVICWIGCPFEAGDYTIPNAFCPAVGGTGTPSASNGFSAYCNKGNWELIVAGTFFEETKQSSPGSKFSNSLGNGSNFSPITVGKILASSTLLRNGNGFTVTVNAISLRGGASHTLTTPISANVYGYGHGIAIDATQPGLKEAAGWLASQWTGQPDGAASVTLTFNGGAAQGSITVASGHDASIVLQQYAGS
jgi:hypothetical protein